MRLSIFGTGYVGLVTGACFAEMGNDVCCVDIDAGKVARLCDGEVPIHEPGLESLVRRNAADGRLVFTTDARAAVERAQVLFIAVGTPSDEDGSADVSYVLDVARTIATHMPDRRIVVDKSTVPVGTGDIVRQCIRDTLEARGRGDLEFAVVSNPEFLKEGAAVSDFMKPDRIVIGGREEWAIRTVRDLYAPLNRNHDRVMVMDLRSAELTKYAANVMLATRISLMNELSNLADRLGADIEQVRRGIGSDSRIGFSYIYPGCGYGGSCFPKDVKALLHTGRESGLPMPLVGAVENVNERQKHVLVDKLVREFGEDLRGRRFALWGLAFKPNTDDMREAPSRVVMEALWARGATVAAYDPVAMDECRRIYGDRDDLTLVDRATAALDGADALVIVTEWNEFRSPDLDSIAGQLRQPVIFDGRNLFEPERMQALGLRYFAIGRGVQ